MCYGGQACWCEQWRRSQFHLVIPRRDEIVYASIDPRRNLSGTVFNWELEDISPRGITKKILEQVPVSMLVTERGSCLIDAWKEISIATTEWSELPRGQCCKAWQEQRKVVKNKTSKEACCSDLLGKRVGKSMI